jgi:hypothetical protein
MPQHINDLCKNNYKNKQYQIYFNLSLFKQYTLCSVINDI